MRRVAATHRWLVAAGRAPGGGVPLCMAAPAGAIERLVTVAPLAVNGAHLVRDLAKPCAPSKTTFAIQNRVGILSYCF